MITPKKAKPKDLPPVIGLREHVSQVDRVPSGGKTVEMGSNLNLNLNSNSNSTAVISKTKPIPEMDMEAEAGEIREEVVLPPVVAPVQAPALARNDPALGLDHMDRTNERSPIKLNGMGTVAVHENLSGREQDRAGPTDLERYGKVSESVAVPLPSPRSEQTQSLHGPNGERTGYTENAPDARRREDEREYGKDAKSYRDGRSSTARSRSRSPRALGRASEVSQQEQVQGQGRDSRRADLPVQVPLAPRADRYSASTAIVNQRRSRSPVRATRSPIPRPAVGRARSRSRSRSRSSRSTSSRSRSRSRSRSSTRSRKIPTAPKGPRNFNPPTGPSGRGGFVPRGGYRGRGAGYQYTGYGGRGGYAAPAWGGRYPAATGTGALPAGPAADRLPPSTPSGPSSEREREREREERERARDGGQTPVVGKWAARKAQDAVARTPEAGGREDGRPPLSSSPVRSMDTAARDYRSAREVERSPLPERNGEETKRTGLTRQDTGVSSIGNVKREHVALPPAVPAQPRQEVRISLTQATKPIPEMERKLSAIPSISTPKSMASPLQIEGERKMQQVLSPLGSSVPSRPITPIPQTGAVKQEYTQQGPSSRPSSSHAPSTQQAQPQLQNPQPQRTRSHRHVDRSWRGYPAPKEILARPRQISEVLVHVPDSDKMEVDASEDTGAVIRIRTREAIPGTEHLDAEVSIAPSDPLNPDRN